MKLTTNADKATWHYLPDTDTGHRAPLVRVPNGDLSSAMLRTALIDLREQHGRRWPLVLLRAIWETR